MQVSASCSACGSKTFVIPDEGEEDQMIRCADCGVDVGDKQKVLEALQSKAKEEVDKLIDSTIGKSGLFKRR
ncbi:ECs_2282 family putative zinc-binding protein [Pseudomonas fluorescens]